MKIIVLLFALSLAAQAQYMQAIPAKTADNCDARADKMEKWLLDWPNLARYRRRQCQAHNARHRCLHGRLHHRRLEHVAANSSPASPYIDRGISGQTTPQMLIRFRPDVIDAQAQVVVILAGTNDIAGNTGPMTLEMIEDNYSVHGCHRPRQ